MDFKIFIDTLLTGTPIAILAALVGIVWQAIYVHSRDKLHDEQVKRELDIEQKKFDAQLEIDKQRFEHQKQLEILRFQYEQKRWREELAREITLRLVEARIKENSEVWIWVKSIALHQLQDGKWPLDHTKTLAQKIKEWRYGKGGLLAEEVTRDVAFTFQTALWEYNGSQENYKRIRQIRRIFREALRADMGMGENIRGQTIYETAEKHQKIKKELHEIQAELGISQEVDTEGG